MTTIQEIEQSYNIASSQNKEMQSALAIRLDTRPILEDLEMYLKSEVIKFMQLENGQIAQKRVKIGTPKANPEGIHAILSIVSGILNPQVVQGNFVEIEKYDNYVKELNLALATCIMENLSEWGIEERNYNLIIDQIMLMCIPFLTRPIKNRERESYGTTFKTVENATLREQNSGGFSLFGRSNNRQGGNQ
jgi:hypothetical protein